mmetsp:Transcript_42473/g.48261  ORF Transcript_42473/g.48261 Transcript_42473/m.48261 type:complete len:106 (+) Transcript_42473:1-318(+)
MTQKLENQNVSESELPKKNTTDTHISHDQTPQQERSERGGQKARNSSPLSPQPFRDCDSTSMEDDEDEDPEQDIYAPSEIKTGTLYASEVISEGPYACWTGSWEK